MSLASAQKFVSQMKTDREFRAAVISFSTRLELDNSLHVHGYDFDLPDLIKAMAACMAELDQCCSQ